MLNAGIFILSFCFAVGEGYVAGKKQYQIQNGPCSYTFLLPEQETCPPSNYGNQVQKDDPAEYEESLQRLEQLETIMENNTQWLLKVQVYPSLNNILKCFGSHDNDEKLKKKQDRQNTSPAALNSLAGNMKCNRIDGTQWLWKNLCPKKTAQITEKY